MQWALFIPSLQQLKLLENPWQDKKIYNLLQQEHGEIDFSRMYFGQEFCEIAMPSLREIKEALSSSKGKEFTLVTPYVTEKGLAKLLDIFKYLARYQPYCEIVVNDWGVLHLLKHEFPTLRPVLGRLLNKMLRDPRVKPYSPGLKHFQTCSLAGPQMKDLLHNKYKVKMIEIDHLPQGIDNDITNWGYQVAMYIPYGYVTTGRICFFQSWGLQEKEKFKTTKDSCQHLCKSQHLQLSSVKNLFSQNPHWDLIQRGNTIFYSQKSSFLDLGLKNALDIGINRLIYQPEPF